MDIKEIKKGDFVRILDKEKIEDGYDLTNGKEYKVLSTLTQLECITIVDDVDDILPITAEEVAAQAIEKVEKGGGELDELLDKFVAQIKKFIEAETTGRKHDEIKIDMRNLARKTIIEDAKKFVEEHTKNDCFVRGNPAITFRLFFGVNAEFHVNKEKRVVTLLLRGAGDGQVIHKEVVRCAPTDVFNEYIGKAIAVGRAFNINVDKFINAAQPREVVVGQEFIMSSLGAVSGKTGAITKMEPELDGIYGTAFRHTIDRGWLGSEQVRITDDTEAIYE